MCQRGWSSDFFSTLLNVTRSTYEEGYLCPTDSFSTGKRCFLVSFADGVGEKESSLCTG